MKTPDLRGLMAGVQKTQRRSRCRRAAGTPVDTRKVEAYSPFLIEEVNEALDCTTTRLPLLVLCGGIVGGLTGYLLQYYIAVYRFSDQHRRRPLHSWPSFIIITFESDDSVRCLVDGAGFVGADAGCPCHITRCSIAADLLWHHGTAFPDSSRRDDPLSRSARHTADFLNSLYPREVVRGCALRHCLRMVGTGIPARSAFFAYSRGAQAGMPVPHWLLVLLPSSATNRLPPRHAGSAERHIPAPSERDFFADGRSARPLPRGTVARESWRGRQVFFTGKTEMSAWTGIPFPVTRAVSDRGQERFNIYCPPCHGRLGNGLGMIVTTRTQAASVLSH